jgi:hypothetical protein
MVTHFNFVGISFPNKKAQSDDDLIRHNAALILEVRERVYVLQLASCEFLSLMTELAADSRERIYRSQELLCRYDRMSV